jgi:hypothetical protein
VRQEREVPPDSGENGDDSMNRDTFAINTDSTFTLSIVSEQSVLARQSQPELAVFETLQPLEKRHARSITIRVAKGYGPDW